MKRDLHFDVFYPHPIERVWAAVTDSQAMSEWLMPNDFEPRVGHRFTFTTKPQPGFDGIVQCEVQEIDPPKRLVFTWAGGGMQTLLTIRLEPATGGTRVQLDHTGFEGVRAIAISYILGNGWPGILKEKLAGLLDRRTT